MTTVQTDRPLGLSENPIYSSLFINGEYVAPLSGETYVNVSPIDGAVINSSAAAGTADVDRAVAAAREAFENGSWRDLSPRERKTILLRFAELLVANKDELAALITVDMGKPIGVSEWEVGYCAANIQWMAEAVDHIYGEVAPLGPNAMATIVREPVGVVAAVVPWNFPLLMPVWKMGPALASGNTMVLKPAEQAALASLRIGELASQAGIPNGVFNVVTGLGEVAGKALAQHMDVDAVTFTGSTQVGRLIMGYAAASNLKKVSLELGGKSPNIVFADAKNLATVAAQTAAGIFGNSGQMCDCSARLIAHESIADELLDLIVREAESWGPGNPFERDVAMGPVVDETQMNKVLGMIAAGVDEGAVVATGGSRVLEGSGGYYVPPTVLSGVTGNMSVARQEIFGPVLSVLTFKDEDEAVRIAHDTDYGLAAAVWTNDVSRAHRVAKRLKAGTVWINAYDAGDITLPHGGFKQSGFGRDKSLHAFDNYTQQKATYVNLSE